LFTPLDEARDTLGSVTVSRIWEALKLAQLNRPRSGTSATSDLDRRKAPRQDQSVPVLVYGSGADKQPFHEQAETINAAESGCLLGLDTAVARGQRLFLTNTHNQAEQECRVVHVSKRGRNKARIGVAFPGPAPEFWHHS
jgi:hypothetical protein